MRWWWCKVDGGKDVPAALLRLSNLQQNTGLALPIRRFLDFGNHQGNPEHKKPNFHISLRILKIYIFAWWW
jgi:hypothetical protein